MNLEWKFNTANTFFISANHEATLDTLATWVAMQGYSKKGASKDFTATENQRLLGQFHIYVQLGDGHKHCVKDLTWDSGLTPHRAQVEPSFLYALELGCYIQAAVSSHTSIIRTRDNYVLLDYDPFTNEDKGWANRYATDTL